MAETPWGEPVPGGLRGGPQGRSQGGLPGASRRRPVAAVVADERPGVRAGLRWLLEQDPGIVVAAEAGSAGGARSAAADVVVTGLRLRDGTAADVAAGPLPTVVVVWLPADERADVDLRGAAAVLRTGALRATLAATVHRVAAIRVPAASRRTAQ